MDIKKPQLVKVEAFADFFQSGIPSLIQNGSLEKMGVLQHPPPREHDITGLLSGF